MPPTRRDFLAISAAAALPLAGRPARAATPPTGAQAPGFYRFKVGSLEVTALLDGTVEIETTLFAGSDPTETARLLARNFLPAGPKLRSPVNAYLVNAGPKTVLIDTGSAKTLGPAMGDLLGGQVDLMCDQTTNTSAQIESGKVKAFAVTTTKRLTAPASIAAITAASDGPNRPIPPVRNRSTLGSAWATAAA